MNISEIRSAEARLEVKAAAVLNLLQAVNRQSFGLTLEGVLKEDPKGRDWAAFNWMHENYEIVASVIYATADLADDVYNGMCELDSMLSEMKEASINMTKARIKAKELYEEILKGATV